MRYAWLLLAGLVLVDILVWTTRFRSEARPAGPVVPPLYQAIVDGDSKRIEALATKENVRKDEKPYGTPLVFAASYGDLNVIPALIEAGADANDRRMPFGQTALGVVVGRRDLAATRCLLEHGADPNAPCGVDGHRPHDWLYAPDDAKLLELLSQYGHDKAPTRGTQNREGANRWQAARLEDARKMHVLLLSRGGRNGS